MASEDYRKAGNRSSTGCAEAGRVNLDVRAQQADEEQEPHHRR